MNAGYCTMWARNLDALAVYYNAMLREWLRRGFKTGVSTYEEHVIGKEAEVGWPEWWGDDALHSNHRVALLAKDPAHYSAFGWCERPPTDGLYEYVWPEYDEAARTWTLRPPRSGRSQPKSKARAAAKGEALGRKRKRSESSGASTRPDPVRRSRRAGQRAPRT